MTHPDRPRRYLRRPLVVEFRVRDADDLLAGEIMFDAIDISEGGAFLHADYLLERGALIEVSFTLPGTASALQVRARVAWVTHREDVRGEAGMGLEFVELTRDEREAIAGFVRAQHER